MAEEYSVACEKTKDGTTVFGVKKDGVWFLHVDLESNSFGDLESCQAIFGNLLGAIEEEMRAG